MRPLLFQCSLLHKFLGNDFYIIEVSELTDYISSELVGWRMGWTSLVDFASFRIDYFQMCLWCSDSLEV